PGPRDRVDAPRDRDGRAPGRAGFREAVPAVPGPAHGRGGEETPGCGTVPPRRHGTEDRSRGRLPRARRGTRRDHGSRPPRPGRRRKGGDAPRPQVSRRVFSADRVRGAAMSKVPQRWFEGVLGADYLV